jgi:hypothetical protein
MPWDKEHKDWEYDRPLHRIKSPSYNPNKSPADGRGYDKGCRAPSDGPDDSVFGLIIRRLMRTIPGWVPIDGENETELEGALDRSFQTWTDVPVWQWHRWYDWNFHVTPSTGYEYVKGLGNKAPEDPPKDQHMRMVGAKGSMECEWDCGAFGKPKGGRPNLGPMFSADWAWPWAGQYVWIAGRWIYDCGHSSSDDKSVGLMRSELHPCKAVATARWEAVNFPENGKLYVPAIQFMFFASHLGGYKQSALLNKTDYEFIVDLPKLDTAAPSSAQIGPTPEFPLNTVVLRTPHLLHKFDYSPFSGAAGTAASVVPTIEPILPDDPGTATQQVKIKVPLSQASSGDYFGVIISLGWYDPDGSQARKVKHCQVKLDHLFKGSVDHDTFSEEWSIKIGVNGRWYTQYWDGVHNNTSLMLNAPIIDLWLSEDDSIYVSSHGAEIDLVGDFFDRTEGRRTLRLNGKAIDWDADVVPFNRQKLWDICYELADMMFFTFNDQNDPLGIIDPGHGRIGNERQLQDVGNGVILGNPIRLKNVKDSTLKYSLIAFSTEEVGESAELEESTSIMDYRLIFSVDVKRQQVP